jgi:hypothetical protein
MIAIIGIKYCIPVCYLYSGLPPNAHAYSLITHKIRHTFLGWFEVFFKP